MFAYKIKSKTGYASYAFTWAEMYGNVYYTVAHFSCFQITSTCMYLNILKSPKQIDFPSGQEPFHSHLPQGQGISIVGQGISIVGQGISIVGQVISIVGQGISIVGQGISIVVCRLYH